MEKKARSILAKRQECESDPLPKLSSHVKNVCSFHYSIHFYSMVFTHNLGSQCQQLQQYFNTTYQICMQALHCTLFCTVRGTVAEAVTAYFQNVIP
jgi:hypothetical protein